ncbi:MAG: cyclic pyranopterin monophosphate synthase MoaC [Thermodesulfobacteria bacterium]|nr:cyclic pyranopterin monophosphate synthase MoaC [Thermodesulfobacteriota bacterium]
MTKDFTHLDPEGHARMVDVSDKTATKRVAVAMGLVKVGEETYRKLIAKDVPKGDVFGTARIAGIMAAKQVGGLIPLCHPLPVEYVGIDFKLREDIPGVEIKATTSINAKTGVEMEAMTAVSVAALTIYDMCKGIDKGIEILEIKLLEKSGGKSGHWIRKD